VTSPEPVAAPRSHPTRLVLASRSPARLQTLRAAGLAPEVVVSGVDESQVRLTDPAALATRLAVLKAEAVADAVDPPGVVVGCDSVLALDGEIHGKPASAAEAVERWRRMRGSSGVLHTGHCVVDLATRQQVSGSGATTVRFADVSDAEIAAYVATGEPLEVAGAFTLDGLGGAFVTGIEGDPHNVVGISLPLLRTLVAELGHRWPDFWAAQPGADPHVGV
jgi:septum formation protein